MSLRAPAAPEPDALLSDLFEPDVWFASSPIVAGMDDLAGEERALVEKAVAKRQREFAQGRALARSLLADLGAPAQPLLRDADRVPLWPEGFVGSISHTHDLCAVAVARAGPIWGVGIDVEPAEPLEAALEARICTEVEQRFVARHPEAEARRLVRAFFCVKEAVYKACFPRLRERWGFHDLGVEIAPHDDRFVAIPAEGSALAGRRLAGRVAQRERWWLAAFTLRPGAAQD